MMVDAMKKYSIITSIAIISILIMPLASQFGSGYTEPNWGVSVGQKYYYTAGMNIDLNMPQQMWELMDDYIKEIFNSSIANLTEADFTGLDAQAMFDAFKTQIPVIINIEMTVKNISERYWQYERYESVYEYTYGNYSAGAWVSGFYDEIADVYVDGYTAPSDGIYVNGVMYTGSQPVGYVGYWFDTISYDIKLKLPSNGTYMTIEQFMIMYLDYYLTPFVVNHFPAGNIANNYTEAFSELSTDIKNSTNDPNFESPFVDIPIVSWFKGDNYTSNSMYYFNPFEYIMPNDILNIFGFNFQYGMSLPLNIPQDANLGRDIQELKNLFNYYSSRAIGNYPYISFGGINGLLKMVDIDFIANPKELWLDFKLDKLKGLPKDVLEVFSELYINELSSVLENITTGLKLNNDSLTGGLNAALRYNSNGMLDNFHGMVNASLMTNTSESVSIFFQIDISQSSIYNGKYTGRPFGGQQYYPPITFESWGIQEGNVNKFTMGFDYQVNMSNSNWDKLSDVFYKALNESFYYQNGNVSLVGPIDIKAMVNGVKQNIPNIVNLELKTTDIGSVTNKEYIGNGKSVENNIDLQVSQIQTKLTNETNYTAPGNLMDDYLYGASQYLKANYPADFVNITIEQLDLILSQMDYNVLNLIFGMNIGKNITINDVARQFSPSITTMWLANTNASTDVLPPMLSKMGFTPYDQVAMVHYLPIFVPTGFNASIAYNDLVNNIEQQMAPNSAGNYFNELTNNLSISKLGVKEKEIRVEMTINGMQSKIIEFMGLQEPINYFIQNIDQAFGIKVINDTLNIQANLFLKWNPNGVLDNFHIDLGLNIQTNDSQTIAANVMVDLSLGEYNFIGAKFIGRPPVETYNQWTPPKDQYTTTLSTGQGHSLAIIDDIVGKHCELILDTTGEVTISLQMWDNNPTTQAPVFANNSIMSFMAIDVSDISKIVFPIKMKFKMPEQINKSAPPTELLARVNVAVLNEQTGQWITENFSATITTDKKFVIVEITHLSVFGVGFDTRPANQVIPPNNNNNSNNSNGNGNNNGTTTDQMQNPFGVDGYPSATIGSIGIMTLIGISIYSRKKRRLL
jgi:hypothetical protein